MTRASRVTAAVFILSFLGVMFGGAVITGKLTGEPAYAGSVLHEDFWRAGHAHAAAFLVLALVCLPWIDAAALSDRLRWFARIAISSASITFPLGFFLAAPTPETTEAGPALALLWPGGAVLAAGLVTLAVGLFRAS
ncbi:MAG: hypothetical protein V2J24_06935 [Pseudomonadales bacterium]|jgi:hypothetical protein|nr:hypothetical protein [Pseudomonadales bacterium]